MEIIGGAVGIVLMAFWLLWITSLPLTLFPKTYEKLNNWADKL